MAKNPFSNTTNKKKSTDDSLFQAVLDRSYQRSVESRRTSPAPSATYQSKVETTTTPSVVGSPVQTTTPAVNASTRKQQIEARLKQIESEYRTTATVLSGYHRGGLQKSNAYLTAKDKADSLKAEKSELEKELQAVYDQMAADEGYREANLIDNTWNSFTRGWNNSRFGEESFDEMKGRENEKQKYKDILAGEDYAFVPSNMFEKAVSGTMEQMGQMARQTFNERTLSLGIAGMGTGFAVGTAAGGGLGSLITAPAGATAGMTSGLMTGNVMSNFEIESGLAYDEMLENGVSPETAKKVAQAVGGVNAALELIPMEELVKTYKILKNNPATVGAADTLSKRLLDVGIVLAKSVGKETAQEVAQEATTIHGVQQATKMDTGKKAYTGEEIGDRLVDTAISSALTFGLMNVPSAVAGTRNAVHADRVGSTYNADVNALIEEGLQSDPSSKSYEIASKLKTRLDNGGTVSNTEAYDLAAANAKAIDTENKLRIANNPPQAVETSVETAPVQSRVSTIQSRLAEAGMEATKAETAAKSIDRILSGDTTITNKDKDVLSVGNKEARAIFEEETGVKLPASNSSTRKTISDYVAQTALKQQKQESTATVAEKETVVSQPPVNVMSTNAVNQLKDRVAMPTVTTNSAEAALRQAAEAAATRSKVDNAATVQSDMTSLGTNGQRVYQKHLGNAKSVTSYSNAFQRYYDAGQIGLPFESIKTAYDDGADRGVLYEAYSAGQNDASVAQKGKPTITNKSAQKGKKKPSKGKGRFYDHRTSEGRSVDEKTIKALEHFAKVFNIDIELVDSIDVGKHKSAANGYYDRSANKIYLAADSDNPLITVLKHEVTHYIQKNSPEQYKALKDYVMKAFYENSQEAMNFEIKMRINDAARKGVKLTRSQAMDEIVADATEKFLTDRDSIDALVRENRSLAETILNAIRDVLKKIEAAMKGEKLQGYSDFMNADQLKQAEKMWVEALAAAAEGSEVGVNFAEINESSAPIWSLKSMKFDLLDGQMQRDLVEHGIMTVEESQNLMDQINKLIDDMSPFARIVDMNEEYSKGNRPFNVYKPNSDPLYKVSLDFSTLCKKRLMTQFVMESLQTKLGKALSAKEQLAIRSKLEEYGKTNKQIQVACALCYVEARRLKAPDQINRFLDDRTTILTDYFGKKNKEYKASVDEMADRMKVDLGYKADTKLKNMKPADKKKVNDAKQKMMKQYIPTAEEQKIIERANAIDNKEFLSQAGLTNLSLNDPVIYDAFVTHVRNATKSKALESSVPYYYGDSKSVSDALIEAMNAENGLRHQSWSDFEIVHLLDNIAAVIELSVRKAKMHAYTKVPDFVKVNGKTGIMINLSLIPAGKTGIKDGKLDFSPTEGMDYQVAVDLRDQYHKTTGTIAIGIDDQQITMMLDDDTIDYVIPYHTSGMNAQLRMMAGISGWADYESFQSEKEIKGAEQGDCPDELWHKKPDFSEWFDTSKLDMSKSGVEIMREAAGRYLVLCEERGLKPKFSDTKKHTDFSKHENYWKLLIDRKMVDKDGNIIIQQTVRPDFDFDLINQVVAEEVANYDPALLDSINERVSKEWESGGIKQREKELLAEEKKAKKAKKKAAKVANGLLEQVVMPEGAQFSLKLGKQEYRQVQSARMNKYAGVDEADIPRIDYVYARDQFYVVENFALDGFSAKSRMNPEKKSDLINFLMGVIDNGDLENFTGDSNALETLWSNHRRRIRDLRDRDRRGEGRGTSRLAAGSRESSEGKPRSGGGRETGGDDLKQYSLKDTNYMDAVKRGDMETAQQMVTEAARENGYTPVKRYHQTSGGFTRFSTDNPKAALHDSETPNGIFFKDNDHDIGLEGKVQMQAYLKANNMLHFRNREEANRWYCDNVDGYAHLQDEYNAALKPFLDELDEIEKKMFDKDTTEEEYAVLDEKEEKTIDEMREVEDSYRGRLRDLLNDHFLDGTSGYDGIELDYDGHRWVNGKRENVHTYIVFDPAQAKSADPVTYDDNGNVIPLSERFNTENDDIRYQLKTPDDMLDLATEMRHKAKAVTDAEIMEQAVKDLKLTTEERTVIRNYQNALKKLAAYEQDLAVYEATKGEHGKGRSFYTDASGKVKKSGVKYSAAERADIQRKVELWKKQLREIEQRENFQKILKREKAKMAERHAKEVADIRAKYDQRLSDLRAKRDEKVEAEKQKMRDYKQHQRDSKEYKALKSKLEADVNWLSERLVHPTESKHIPDKFRGIVAKFLETLDFTTERMDKNAKNGNPSSKTIKLWSLVAEYQKIALDDGAELVLTPLEEDMVELIQKTVDGKKVEDLTYDELGVVRDIIRYIKIGVSKANGMFNAEIKETYSELGETLIEEQISKKRRKEFDPDSAMGRADKLLFYDNVTPADMFHRFGGVMEKLYNEIRKGFDKHIENVSTSMNYIQKLIDGYDVKKWANTAAEFKLSNGKTVELTQTQVMSLYCLMKREQAVGHILGSGIVPSGVVIKEEKPLSDLMKSKAKDVTLSDAERKQKEQAFAKRLSDATAKVSRKINENGSQVSFEDVQKIIGTLTADQKKVADGVMKFFVTKCADWGNETSLRMFDIKKFTEENYFPIKSSDAFLNERFDDSGDVLIKNTGFTKNTVVNANNPIVIDDIFNVFTDHATKMSMYNALVVPLTDFTKVYNYKRKSADNTRIETSVKDQIKAAYGTQATAYVTQFIKDVNRQANTLAAESFGAKNLARFKKAKIGANLRVLAQQPTSIVRAAAMVDPKYLTKGLAQKANYEEMFSNSEIALWKSWGFFQTDTSRGMKDILLGNESKLDKVTMGLYGKADDFAWGHLWNAIKLEQADAHPDMDTTSSEFLDLVAERFEEVVDRTQVVDSVFHRSQLMRSNSVYVKMVTAFMAEGTKSYNLLMSAWTDMKNTGDKRKFTRVLASYVASAVATSWAAAWVDALRDDEDEDDEGNERDFITKQMDATLANMLDNIVPMNLVPYAKDIWSTFSGYDVTRTDMASYTNFSKAMRKVVSDKYGWPYKVKVLIDATADLFGIPVKNAARDVYGIIRTAGNAMGGWRWGDYFVEKSTHNISNPDNRSKFYKHYTDALLAGDEAAADKILMDMVTNGIPRDNIIAKGYQVEKNATFSEARKLIADGKADDAKKLIKGLARKYSKKYTTLWKAVKSGDSADVPEETYEFKDLQKAVRKGEDTELIEDYLTEYGGYSEEDLEEAIKLLTEKYK